MSGIQLTTDNTNNAFSVDAIIKQIKESQENVLKAFEEHNKLVNKSLELLNSHSRMRINGETFFEHNTIEKVFVKVKDPLEEIKNVKELFDRYELDLTTRCGFLTNIFNILLLYNKDKISASFKDIFLNILKRCLDINTDTQYISFHFKNQLKENILKVRDIRWLLLEMEKYPQYFQFTEDDLTIMKENGASRDNIYLVKKLLKKDGDYEEMYEEEEGGGIKLQYHMTGGHLNGEYKEYYPDGNLKQETSYKDGLKYGYERVFMNNGDRVMESKYKEDKLHGEHKRYFQNRLILYSHYKNGNLDGEYKGFNIMSGDLEEHYFYKDGVKV
jgi:hypothetical protein